MRHFCMVVVCSMHVIYCFQLERFLCRDCGKVKCSCDAPSPADNQQFITPSEPNLATEHRLNETLAQSDPIEYRKITRQNSGPEKRDNLAEKSHLTHRSSEQPFARSGENGKLRRSFAVRSREGIENLLSFAKGNKAKEIKTNH